VTRDVVFDEQAQWDWGTGGDNGELNGGDDVFTVEYTTIGQAAPETEGGMRSRQSSQCSLLRMTA
jgi:hypothetical protein